jgi:hypothetical protein
VDHSAPLHLAALAAVFPEVIRQRADRGKLRAVVVKRSLVAARQQSGFDEALQMMTEGGRGQIDVRLDLACGGPLGAALDDIPEDRKANRVTKGAELFAVSFELWRHGYF